MSNPFLMDTEDVTTGGKNINESGTSFQEQVTSFKSHTAAIMGVWSGPDAEEFQTVAEQVAEQLDKASLTVQNVGEHFVNTAVGTENQVAENKDSIARVMG